MATIASYEEVKALPNHPEKYLIDVREPTEVAETVGNLEESLKLSYDDSKSKFGRDKPATDNEVIFHCKMGGRAAKASLLAESLGFVNSKSYKGSWTEWARKEGI